MRSILLAAALALGTPAAVLAQSSQMPESGSQPSATPTVKALSIVDVSELPKETQDQVEQVAKKATKADREGMKNALDRSPAIKKALADKGADSSMVIATNLDAQGTLTLVTKKKA